jgi:hypothetical protein
VDQSRVDEAKDFENGGERDWVLKMSEYSAWYMAVRVSTWIGGRPVVSDASARELLEDDVYEAMASDPWVGEAPVERSWYAWDVARYLEGGRSLMRHAFMVNAIMRYKALKAEGIA